MAANYVLLNSQQLTSSAASITFSNIPQSGYTDLKIVYSARNTSNASVVYFTCNGSAANRSMMLLYGSGSATGSFSGSDSDARIGLTSQSDYTSNTFSNGEVYIPNYTSSNYKSISADAVQENNGSTAYAYLLADLWSNTAAITSFTLTPINNSFAQYSTFSLYGLAAVGTTPVLGPKASGGNIVTTDGTYWYHGFLTSGYFTPIAGLTCDYLVVAGGGGGGGGLAGGGGAGGFRTATSQSFTTQNYSITVGAGGPGTSVLQSFGFSGTNSVIAGSGFTTYSATGGGGGASISTNGLAGGSGGGGGGSQDRGNPQTGGAGNAGSYSPVEGYAGGQGIYAVGTSQHFSGGGGGAGAVGGNAANGTGGNGGIGSYSAISGGATTGVGVLSGGNYYLAAGGGGAGRAAYSGTGGTGGTGGGGNGAGTNLADATSATANTGSGGGGGDWDGYGVSGAAGGSGLVIIRYAV